MTINKFKAVKIKDVGKVITGKTPPTSQPELFGDKYPFITPSDIPSFDVRYIDFVERGLSDKGFDKQKRYALPKDTVCYVCIGSTIGKVCLTNKVSFTNQQINSIVVNRDKFNPKYVYYLLRSETPKIQAISGGTGAGKAILNKSSFEDIDLNVFPLHIQNKIATILSTYDDLIENNTRRIKILEEMAQLIYREWFVKFRFPGHEKVRMVDSELGPIPEGWELVKLGDVIDIQKGKKAKNVVEVQLEGYIPYLLIDGIKNRSYVYTNDEKMVIAKETDCIMVMDGASSGYVSIGHYGAVGSTLARFVAKEKLNSYLIYQYLQANYKIISDNNTGSAIPHANKDFINGMLIPIPPLSLIKIYTEHIEPIFKLTWKLSRKNSILRRTRDLLLPKLISGELDVEDLDIAVGGD